MPEYFIVCVVVSSLRCIKFDDPEILIVLVYAPAGVLDVLIYPLRSSFPVLAMSLVVMRDKLAID